MKRRFADPQQLSCHSCTFKDIDGTDLYTKKNFFYINPIQIIDLDNYLDNFINLSG